MVTMGAVVSAKGGTNFDTNTSTWPAEIKLNVPGPGSKSAVPAKDPVV
jgi:hypothetical protein